MPSRKMSKRIRRKQRGGQTTTISPANAQALLLQALATTIAMPLEKLRAEMNNESNQFGSLPPAPRDQIIQIINTNFMSAHPAFNISTSNAVFKAVTESNPTSPISNANILRTFQELFPIKLTQNPQSFHNEFNLVRERFNTLNPAQKTQYESLMREFYEILSFAIQIAMFMVARKIMFGTPIPPAPTTAAAPTTTAARTTTAAPTTTAARTTTAAPTTTAARTTTVAPTTTAARPSPAAIKAAFENALSEAVKMTPTEIQSTISTIGAQVRGATPAQQSKVGPVLSELRPITTAAQRQMGSSIMAAQQLTLKKIVF